MNLWNILPAVYVLTIVWAIIMTYREQRRAGPRRLLFNMIGYLACTVWPVVATVILLTPRSEADFRREADFL